MKMPEETKKKLANVPPEENFRMENGGEIRNLHELIKTLKEVSKESFKNHVNEEKNDFSTWIKHSIGDSELADKLLKTTELEETIKVMQARIAFLENNVEFDGLVSNTSNFEMVEDKEDNKKNEKPVIEALNCMQAEKELGSNKEKIADVDNKGGVSENNSEAHTDSTHVKNTMLTIRDTMFGFVLGIVAGFIIGYFIWSGF